MNRIYVLIAAVFYTAIFFLLFPWYQYVIDIDAISYIHVAERFAKGEYYYSVNGYWSPLISWILVPFIRAGEDPVIATKYINGFIGLLSIFSAGALMEKFNIQSTLKKIIPFVFAILFVSYAFYELCADLLNVFLLLLYLNLVFSKNFINDTGSIIFAGVLGALCYFSKAYSFPFFLLHFAVVTFVLLKKSGAIDFKKKWLIKLAIAFVTFFIIVTPYIAVLTHKYGSVRINNAGRLNTSWFLSPGISDTRKMVADIPFDDATSYWDEPTYAQEKYVGPFTSPHFFFAQVKWTISNVIKFLGLLNTMSIFTFMVVIAFIVYLYRKKQAASSIDWLLLLTTIILPSGYLLIFIEWRYIWLLPITLLLMGAVALTYLFQQGWINKKIFTVAAVILCVSFAYQPILEMKDLKNNNKDVYEMAAAFKQNNIRGNIFLQYKSFQPYAKTVVLTYLTESKLFGPAILDYSFDELMTAAKKHNINYYLFFYDFPNEKEMFLQSPYAKAGIKVFDNIYPGLIVVQFK